MGSRVPGHTSSIQSVKRFDPGVLTTFTGLRYQD